MLLFGVGPAASSGLTSFSDNFNRANENLTANANYILSTGTAANITVTSNQVATVADAFGTVVYGPATGAGGGVFSQGTFLSTASNRGVLGFTSGVYAKIFKAGVTMTLQVSDGVTPTNYSTPTLTFAVNDVFKVQFSWTVVTVYQNGVSRLAHTLNAPEQVAFELVSSWVPLIQTGSSAGAFLDDLTFGLL